jgi:hypothetical protein
VRRIRWITDWRGGAGRPEPAMLNWTNDVCASNDRWPIHLCAVFLCAESLF